MTIIQFRGTRVGIIIDGLTHASYHVVCVYDETRSFISRFLSSYPKTLSNTHTHHPFPVHPILHHTQARYVKRNRTERPRVFRTRNLTDRSLRVRVPTHRRICYFYESREFLRSPMIRFSKIQTNVSERLQGTTFGHAEK